MSTKTTSLQVSQALAAAGFQQETDYYWHTINGRVELCHVARAGLGDVKSYTLEALIEALPTSIDIPIREWDLDEGYHEVELCVSYDIFYKGFIISYGNDISHSESESNTYQCKKQPNESLADTAGRLWLLLKEKKNIYYNVAG